MSRNRTATEQVKQRWEESLDYFLLVKRSQGLADRTISDYKEHIGRFFMQPIPILSVFLDLKWP